MGHRYRIILTGYEVLDVPVIERNAKVVKMDVR